MEKNISDMAKYDDQLQRMNYLMEFKTEKKPAPSNIEFHATGADGKVYGILREGTKYYIKTTEPGKENLSESYQYINGFMSKKENEFTDYNKATKGLELKLMALNENAGKHEDVSVVDFKRNEKIFSTLTEDARKELDRMQQIFENSCKIGKDCQCDPEAKGKSTGENTVKNNDPFTQKTEAKLDKDPKFNGTVEGATDNKEVKGVDADLQSDKMKTANSGSEKDYKDAHDDLEGDGVADKDPKNAKAVKMNESLFEENPIKLGEPSKFDNVDSAEELGVEEPVDEPVEEPVDEPIDEPVDEPVEEPVDNLAGFDDGNESLESLLKEFVDEFCNEENETTSKITGPDAVMDKEKNPINGTDNGVGDEKGEEWKRIGEATEEHAIQGDEETLKNLQYGFNKEKKLDAQSWDKLNEAVSSVVDKVFENMTKKETLEEAIDRIVKEEVTKLDAWGKHPRFRKEPMTTPDNKEVLAGTADRDWNDDSAKGNTPYAQKIGDGSPFNQSVIDILTDQVMANLTKYYKN